MIVGAVLFAASNVLEVTFDQAMNVMTGLTHLSAWRAHNAAGSRKAGNTGVWPGPLSLRINCANSLASGPPLTGSYTGAPPGGPDPVRAATGLFLANVASFPLVQV